MNDKLLQAFIDLAYLEKPEEAEDVERDDDDDTTDWKDEYADAVCVPRWGPI